jgi:hypothetical protein
MLSAGWQEFLFFQSLKQQQVRDAFFLKWLEETSLVVRDRRRLAAWAERRAAEILGARGHQVARTVHKCPFDLWAGGARVEVKAARWKQHPHRGGWYQADVRPSQKFDLLLFCAVNGRSHWYVVPRAAVGGRRTISVCSYEPGRSRGWLREFLERWDVADEVVRSAGAIPFQLELPGVLQ